MPTIGDVFRVYIKPSLDGMLVIRKKNTNQTSARVEASKNRVRAYTMRENESPSQTAHNNLVALGKCEEKLVYVPGRGYEKRPVCPINEMRKELRKIMMCSVHADAESHHPDFDKICRGALRPPR